MRDFTTILRKNENVKKDVKRKEVKGVAIGSNNQTDVSNFKSKQT
jgi:hypothetical protein